jgi:hypothetical protein
VSKRLIISIWLSSLLVGLLVAVPTTLNFIDHWRAKNYAEQGCKKYWFQNTDSPDVRNSEVRANWSEAARLDPDYLLLASASQTTLVDREMATSAGYLQQWLDGLQVIQGFCDFVLNPQVSKN